MTWTPEPGGPFVVNEADGICRIPVGESYTAIVDAADYALVAALTWKPLHGHNGRVYAISDRGWRARPRQIYMHRLIAGSQRGQETDHRNGDGLDNRRSNLRVASASQNSANMGKPRRPDGSLHRSRFKGVSWDKSQNNWQSKIQAFDPVLGRSKSRALGRFTDEEAAARAYDAAALAQWGEFARLNFPSSEEVAG